MEADDSSKENSQTLTFSKKGKVAAAKVKQSKQSFEKDLQVARNARYASKVENQEREDRRVVERERREVEVEGRRDPDQRKQAREIAY
ncbi:hypothetical protein V6N13_067858 [Hibiscus sabdariffa]|uniref:Uncharacterized protein n=1 Tax=Hibiscus sabdariffa TaxID=183260 RepID=A0ABR2DY20_9ROSI